jgi:hypothetical protein
VLSVNTSGNQEAPILENVLIVKHGSGRMNKVEMGRIWEIEAGRVLSNNGYSVQLSGNSYDSYDLIATNSEESLAINVKKSDSMFTIGARNLERITEEKNPSFIFINERFCMLFILKKIFYKNSDNIPNTTNPEVARIMSRQTEPEIHMKCGKCNREWTYTGGHKVYTSCPSCRSSVRIPDCKTSVKIKDVRE